MEIKHIKSEFDPDTCNTHYFEIVLTDTTFFIYIQDYFTFKAYLFEASVLTNDISYILEKYREIHLRYEGCKPNQNKVGIFSIVDYIPEYFSTRESYYCKIYTNSKGKFINYRGHRIHLPETD